MWYYSENNKMMGPVSLEAIVEKINSGVINQATIVCLYGSQPCPAGQHPELSSFFSARNAGMNSQRQAFSQPQSSAASPKSHSKSPMRKNAKSQSGIFGNKILTIAIILAAGFAFLMVVTLAVLAKIFFFSHKKSANENPTAATATATATATADEDNSKLTFYEGYNISQITEPPLVPSKHRPGEKRTLYCKGQEFVFRWCPPGRFMMGSPSTEYPPGTGHCYLHNQVSDSMLDAMGEADIWSKQYIEQMKRENREDRELAYSTPDFKSIGRSIFEVLHPVTLTEGFWMLETEITNKQYNTILNYDNISNDNDPANKIIWEFAQKFCKECSQLGMKVQLPTEAQWEYACRAGTQTAFSFGDSYDELYKYGNYCDVSYSSDNELVDQSIRDKKHNDGYHQLAPVKSFRPNAWGLYDMHGNVSEWCSDPFGGYLIEHEINPTGEKEYKVIEDGDFSKTLYDTIIDRDKNQRVFRGGNYFSHFAECRSASRFKYNIGIGPPYIGFRVMMTDKNMTEALANNLNQPPSPEPADDNDKQTDDNGSKDQSDLPANDKVEETVDKSADNNADIKDDILDKLAIKPSDPKPEPKAEPKAGDTLVKEINRVKFVFKWIPPGIFTMGSPEDEEGRNPNERQYKVKISKGFWMMDSEVTQLQWEAVTGKPLPSRPSPTLPIEDVSWNQCNIFCQKAAIAGLPLELPTEAQWEYACRAGSKGSFAGDFEDLTWHQGNSNSHANPVRTLKPNEWGLYDMHGNVAEWCSDWCGVYPGKPTKDPKGPGEGSKKMTRGGSWGSPKHFCRSALRGGLEPNQHTAGLGFRCVLNISQNDEDASNNNSAKRPTPTSNNQEDLVIVKTNIDKEPFFAARGSGKARAVAIGGGSTESERAVALGLQWIANHQLPNGSWSFNHQLSPSCRGQCTNPGQLDKAFNGATGLALLPFLGAGVTHVNEGKYKTNVNKGINFLCKNGKQTNDDCISFVESGGTIYSHGIVALCLTEAYGMTKDKKLLPVAQGSLNYISYHQDPVSGGWRYQPHQSGDTSATGWQVSALKTGYLSGMNVSKNVITKTLRFLDSVQSDSGAKYGYTDPGAGPTTTAIGLMDRMYLGWKHENPNLQRGVLWLSRLGPSKSDSYYNFYATQTMYQYNVQQKADPMWIKWNAVMRDQMVNTQSQQGHEKGSWYNYTPWTERGGRLYDTALSIMVLETYYRYPSVYKTSLDD